MVPTSGLMGFFSGSSRCCSGPYLEEGEVWRFAYRRRPRDHVISVYRCDRGRFDRLHSNVAGCRRILTPCRTAPRPPFFTLDLGFTRIIVEDGASSSFGALYCLKPALGTSLAQDRVDPRTITGLALSYAWVCDPIANHVPFSANVAKIHADIKLPRQNLSHCFGTGPLNESKRVILFQHEACLRQVATNSVNWC